MKNGPSSYLASSLVPPLASIIPLPVRVRKRTQRTRGSAFRSTKFHEWRKDFDADRIRMWLRSRALAGLFSEAERYVITLLIEYGERAIHGAFEDVTLTSVASVRGKSEASTRRLLSRLGAAGIIVNLGTRKAFNLAVHGQVMDWRMDALQMVRKTRRKAIAEWEQRSSR